MSQLQKFLLLGKSKSTTLKGLVRLGLSVTVSFVRRCLASLARIRRRHISISDYLFINRDVTLTLVYAPRPFWQRSLRMFSNQARSKAKL